MSEVRVIAAPAPERDGVVRATGKVAVNRDAIARELAPQHTRPLTPAEQRLRDEDKWLPDDSGADGLYASGRITVLTPAQQMEAQRRSEDVQVTTTKTSPPPDPAAKAKLAADFRAHAAKVAELAESAKRSGDPAQEAKAAEQVAASRQVGEQLRARGIL